MPLPLLSLDTASVLLGVLLAATAAAVAGLFAYRHVVALERRAAAAERMGELGLLTGGLAHEIKNPLSTLQLNLQLLAEDLTERLDRLASPAASPGTAEERRQALGRMQRRLEALRREADRMREILDDFLRYAGTITPDPRPVDVAVLLNDLADFLSPQSQMAKVRVRVEATPLVLSLDENLVRQAVLNLALNALQHTPAGGDVVLAAEPYEGGVRLTVRDTGRGIEAADVERVFDPYYTRRKGGTGLGLALVRRIVQAQGGRVTLDSTPGVGSTFTLHLPMPRRMISRPAAST